VASPPPDARGALLGRLIDHAALFPPASLPMDEALAADRRVRAGDHAWIVDRFICPASRLHELPDDPPALSVVLDGEPTADPRGLPVALVEARCAADAVAGTLERIRSLFGHDSRVFLELPLDSPLDELRAAGVGAKVRCGGEAFPSVGELARFVCGCHEAGVPFKATAGLHHALRRHDRHGFLNVLAAAVFAPAGEDAVTALLAEEDAAAFAVGPDGVSVHGLRAGSGEIDAARREGLVAYGSCSVDEPVEEMLALGILP
jgi:hypothetical protein